MLSRLLLVLLVFLPILTHGRRESPTPMAKCSRLAYEVLNHQSDKEETRFDSTFKKQEFERFNNYSKCLNDLLDENIFGKDVISELLKTLQPIGDNLEFMVGEFTTCYDKLRLDDSKPLVDLLASKSPETCEFSVTELGNLESLFRKKCAVGDAIREQLRSPLAQKMMCGSSFTSIVSNGTELAKIDWKYAFYYYEKHRDELNDFLTMFTMAMDNMKPAEIDEMRLKANTGSCNCEKKKKKQIPQEMPVVHRRRQRDERMKQEEEKKRAAAVAVAEAENDSKLARFYAIFLICFLFGFFTKLDLDSA